MGGGDDPANNGHVESEINQLKRRVRLLLRNAKQDWTKWPNALRYATEQRLRTQLCSLGVSVSPMLPYAAQVAVKRKRWRDPGVTAPPYVEGIHLSPSPHMNLGWVVKTVDDRIVHVREAIVPDPPGDEVAIQLQEEEREPVMLEEGDTPRRIIGKQNPGKKQRISLPEQGTYGRVYEDQESQEENEPTPLLLLKRLCRDPMNPAVRCFRGGIEGNLDEEDMFKDLESTKRVCALGRRGNLDERTDLRKNSALEGIGDLGRRGNLDEKRKDRAWGGAGDLGQSGNLCEKTGLSKDRALRGAGEVRVAT